MQQKYSFTEIKIPSCNKSERNFQKEIIASIFSAFQYH